MKKRTKEQPKKKSHSQSLKDVRVISPVRVASSRVCEDAHMNSRAERSHAITDKTALRSTRRPMSPSRITRRGRTTHTTQLSHGIRPARAKGVSDMPFAQYKDLDDCVAKNKDKKDPKAYCATIMRKVEREEAAPDKTRMLNAELIPDNFVHLKGGGLMVKNIIALAEGTWTDSAVGTPLHYPLKVLEADAGNWIAPSIWSRHAGGNPRDITSKVGTVENPRFDPDAKAIIVDGRFHGRSQASRDVIELIENGIVTDVSAEVGGKEIWNAESKRYEAASLAFYGLAVVDRGACNVCKMKRNEAAEREEAEEKERMEMEQKELEQKLAALETEKVELAKKAESEKIELTKQLEAVSKSKVDEENAHKTAVEELMKKLHEAEMRIKELEKLPAPPKTQPGNGDASPKVTIELEVVTPVVNRGGDISRP